MSEMKHTPGPWYVVECIDGGRPRIDIYKREGTYSHIGVVNGIEDAHLIAAAPELLDALRRLLSHSADWMEYLRHISKDPHDYADSYGVEGDYEAASDAISKALGSEEPK